MDLQILDIFTLVVAFGLIVKSYFKGFYNGIIDCVFFIATFYIAVYIYPYSIEYLSGVTDNIKILNIDKKIIFNTTTIGATIIASSIISKTLDIFIKYIVNFPDIFPFVNKTLGIFVGIFKTFLFLNFTYIISTQVTKQNPPFFFKDTYSYEIVKSTSPTFTSMMPDYFNNNVSFLDSNIPNSISNIKDTLSSSVDDLISDKNPLETISTLANKTADEVSSNFLNNPAVNNISNSLAKNGIFNALADNYNNKNTVYKKNIDKLGEIAKQSGIDNDTKNIFVNSNYKKPYIPKHIDNLDKFKINKLINTDPNKLTKNQLTYFYPKDTTNISSDELDTLFNRDIENLSSKNIVAKIPENIQNKYLEKYSDLTPDEVDILNSSDKFNLFEDLKHKFNRDVKSKNDIEDLSKILNSQDTDKIVHDALIKPHKIDSNIPLYNKIPLKEVEENIIISEPDKIISIEEQFNE